RRRSSSPLFPYTTLFRSDGLAFASARGGIRLNLTPEIVYRALAARPFGREQTAQSWRDVDPSLPDLPILVYGPPSTSGTRDALKDRKSTRLNSSHVKNSY